MLGGLFGAEVLPGFEQEDAGGGVLAEAGGEGGTGGAAADDYEIVFRGDHAFWTFQKMEKPLRTPVRPRWAVAWKYWPRGT